MAAAGTRPKPKGGALIRRLAIASLFIVLSLVLPAHAAARNPQPPPSLYIHAETAEMAFPSPLKPRVHKWPAHPSTGLSASSTGTVGGSGSYGNAAIDAMIASVFTTGTTTALKIADCESHDDPQAKNPSSSATGVFQILGGPTDALANIKLAWSMSSQGTNWTPWNASIGCWG